MNEAENQFRSSFENPDLEQGNLVSEEFLEIDTPDFEKTYKEIKHIIFDGFIPTKLNFADSNLILKSLHQNEFKYVDLITSNPEEKLPLYFLYSIVCLDGYDIIPNRKKYHHEVQEIFRSFPTKVISKIVSIINDVQSYHNKSYENLEGYLYEKESRTIWDVYKKTALNVLFPEINILGYNSAQETWIMFNQREDDRIKDENEYSIAKFIVSGFVGGKEIKKINNQEKMRWNEELRRRQDVRLKNKVDRIRLSRPINTADDLVAELERQIRGEKDQHDKIIEMHEKAVREKIAERKEQLALLRLQAKEMNKEVPVGVSGFSSPISKKDLEEAEKNKKTNNPINSELLKMEGFADYASKLEQMSISKQEENRQFKQKENVNIEKPSSIFDPEIQNELKKLKNLK